MEILYLWKNKKKLGLSPWRVGKAATEASISISAMRTSIFSDLPWGASSTNPNSQSNNTLSHYSLDQNCFMAKDGATWPFFNGCFSRADLGYWNDREKSRPGPPSLVCHSRSMHCNRSHGPWPLQFCLSGTSSREIPNSCEATMKVDHFEWKKHINGKV